MPELSVNLEALALLVEVFEHINTQRGQLRMAFYSDYGTNIPLYGKICQYQSGYGSDPVVTMITKLVQELNRNAKQSTATRWDVTPIGHIDLEGPFWKELTTFLEQKFTITIVLKASGPLIAVHTILSKMNTHTDPRKILRFCKELEERFS